MSIKKLCTGLLITSMVFAGVACKSNATTDNSKKQDDKKESKLTISAASSLKEALTELQTMFNKENPNIELTFNFGGSGSLQQQIEQGAPSDIFISAGTKQMKALEDKDLIIKDTNKALVENSLVLVTSKNTDVTSIDDLTSDKVKQIAVGEPESVPAGKYADEALKNLNLKDKLSSKLVFAKDVKEVLAWTATGNCEAGLVYLSDTKANSDVKVIENIASDKHSPIKYPIAVVKESKNIDDAKVFEDFLFTDEAKKIFEKYGYK